MLPTSFKFKDSAFHYSSSRLDLFEHHMSRLCPYFHCSGSKMMGASTILFTMRSIIYYIILVSRPDEVFIHNFILANRPGLRIVWGNWLYRVNLRKYCTVYFRLVKAGMEVTIKLTMWHSSTILNNGQKKMYLFWVHTSTRVEVLEIFKLLIFIYFHSSGTIKSRHMAKSSSNVCESSILTANASSARCSRQKSFLSRTWCVPLEVMMTGTSTLSSDKSGGLWDLAKARWSKNLRKTYQPR